MLVELAIPNLLLVHHSMLWSVFNIMGIMGDFCNFDLIDLDVTLTPRSKVKYNMIFEFAISNFVLIYHVMLWPIINIYQDI